MFSFKNHREQFNMQGAAQRVPMHTITAGEVRATQHNQPLGCRSWAIWWNG